MDGMKDERGTEQGGKISSDEYQLVGNTELNVANSSGLGILLGNLHIACIGAADDTVLVSDCPYKLQSLLNLSLKFCKDSFMQLVPEKTHLLVVSPKNQMVNPSVSVSLDGGSIGITSSVEHLGLLRTDSLDNLITIKENISRHQRSLFPVLSAGASKGLFSNPAASLRVENLYASPVLFNSLATLVLKKSELDLISRHHKQTLQRIMSLHVCPCEPVHFLSGVPPAQAIIAMKMFSLLGMIARLGNQSSLFNLAMFSLQN